MKLVPGMLVRFILSVINGPSPISLTLIDPIDNSFGPGCYTPSDPDPIGIFLKDVNTHGPTVGVFLFDDKTCFIGHQYVVPVILDEQDSNEIKPI